MVGTPARVATFRGASPWGIFLSEVMAQQTPLTRVEPIWREWMTRWPTPGALAAAAPGDAVRAWGRLGYPRRALRLHEAATVMVERHGGEVPETHAELLALPGVGAYTAGAVACFAFSIPEVVVDTNVRRVLARTLEGKAFPHVTLTRAETQLATSALPARRHTSLEARREANVWNVAVMELGALVCVARGPRCEECPVADLCTAARADVARHRPSGPRRDLAAASRGAWGASARGTGRRRPRRRPGHAMPGLARRGWPC
jgi:A/G-specific adenine glycosylase